MNHRYNVKPANGSNKLSLPYSHLFEASAALPVSIDLSSGFPAAFDQAQEGSCTSQGWAAIYDFFQLQAIRTKATNLEEYEFKANQYVPAARQFIYYNERLIEGDVDQDGGAMVSTGAQVLSQMGFCDESLWPYTSTDIYTKPAQDCYDEALKHKISGSYALNGQDQIIHCLASGFPVVCGIEVFEELESDQVAQTGILPDPSSDEQSIGGHCIVLVGYDLTKNRIKCRNSWGQSWGIDNGYFWVTCNYLNSYGSEFMSVRN